MNEGAWTAIVVAILTGAGGFFTALTTKRKIDAESESVSVSTMKVVLDEVRGELDRCCAQRAEMLERVQRAEGRIGSLEMFLKLNYGVNPEDVNGEPI